MSDGRSREMLHRWKKAVRMILLMWGVNERVLSNKMNAISGTKTHKKRNQTRGNQGSLTKMIVKMQIAI